MSGQTRRELLRGMGGGAGLLIALSLPGCRRAETLAGAAAPGTFAPNAWIRVTSDNRIIFVLDRIEMGQGVMTGHAQMVAEELLVDPQDLEIEFAPVDRSYDNPELGYQITGASTSTHSSWGPLRTAAAAAREALLGAAAAALVVPVSELEMAARKIRHARSGRSVTYGACASDAPRWIPKDPKPLPPERRKLMGRSLPRLDLPAKVRGEAVYGIDARQPDMLTAVLLRAPAAGAHRLSLDTKAARAAPGVVDIVEMPQAIAVVAQGYWAARKAAGLVQLEWSTRPVSDASIRALFKAAAADYGRPVIDRGDSASALEAAESTLDAVYEFPYLAHATMEPQNCAASVREDGCDIWAPTQSVVAAQRVAVGITGLDASKVKVHATYLGGGFGRRMSQDYVAEAVELSKRIGKAVQIIWSREDDVKNDVYRPGSYHVVKAGIRGGEISGWKHRIVSPSILGYMAPQFIGNRHPSLPRVATWVAGKAHRGGPKLDEMSVEGADEIPYRMPDQQLEYSFADPGIPVGFWRSVGHSTNAFVVETMIDELAAAAKADPYEFRRKLLDTSPRHRGVLELAATRANWGGKLPKGIYRGIAQHHSFGSYVAEVVEASVQDGAIKVHRVVIAVDCGQIINPDIVRAQLEGSTVFGLTAALKGRISFDSGSAQESNFHDYRMLRMSEMPLVEVHFVDSQEPPSGVGEPGVPPVAPALANAIFQATGRRVRTLPIDLSS